MIIFFHLIVYLETVTLHFNTQNKLLYNDGQLNIIFVEIV